MMKTDNTDVNTIESEEIITTVDQESKSLFKPENVEKSKRVFTYGMLTVLGVSGLVLVGVKPTHIIQFIINS